MAEQTNGLHDALAAAVAPIKQQLALVEREIEELEATLAQKRKDRTSARNVLRVLDPESVPPTAQQKKKQQSKPTDNIATEKVDELLAWLREHKNGDEFSGPSIAADDPIGRSGATINAGLLVLAARGLIRLDRRDSRNTKWYRLTSAGQAVE